MSWETADYHQLSRVADNLAYAGDMLWLIAQHAGQLERIADALEVLSEKAPVEPGAHQNPDEDSR